MEFSTDVEINELPQVHQARFVLDAPRLIDLSSIYEKLQEAGVPNHAHVRFRPWNIPANRFYVVAAWADGNEDPNEMQDW